MTGNGQVKPRTRADLAEEWIGEEVFLYYPANGDEVHCLNSGAALIWLLCDGTRDVEAIAGELAKSFKLPKAEILNEVKETVDRLESLNLVEA